MGSAVAFAAIVQLGATVPPRMLRCVLNCEDMVTLQTARFDVLTEDGGILPPLAPASAWRWTRQLSANLSPCGPRSESRREHPAPRFPWGGVFIVSEGAETGVRSAGATHRGTRCKQSVSSRNRVVHFDRARNGDRHLFDTAMRGSWPTR